jgi:hypothetical protein
VKLLNASQVSFYRDAIAADIDRSSGHSTQVIQGILSGVAQCWAILSTESDGREAYLGCGVTFLRRHDLTGETYLHIGALAGFGGITDDDWKLMYETIHAYAQCQKCAGIIAGSLNPRVIELAHLCGFQDVEMMMKREV